MILAWLLTVGTLPVWAASDYDASAIPADLQENASAVVREQDEIFTIHASDAATYTIHRAVTVLNKNGERYAPLVIWYDASRKIKSIECTVYDARGTEVKKVKKKDIQDVSAVSSFSIYEDSRLKYYSYDSPSYPYTVEYSYELEFDGLLFYPNWHPVEGFQLAVEQSSFSVITSPDISLRYRVQHTSEPAISTEEGQQKYYWELRHHAAYKKESFRPPLGTLTPRVYLAPSAFSYEGYAGNFSSWQQFGQWINQLNEGRDQLPESTQSEVKRIVANLQDTTEIIRTLYEYMQSKTRYVSIQLGIGGYQPFEATTVDRLGYGDCKALSNYMKALLSVAGIEAYYTLVNAGAYEDEVLADFPSMQFNHVIVGVPLAQDTLWLECTSQTNPFGHLSDFTDERNVLMITENGGQLVRTPAYSAQDNQQTRNTTVLLDEEGNGQLTAQTQYTGQLYDDIARITQLNDQEQKQAVYKQIEIPNFRLQSFHYDLTKDQIPAANEVLKLQLERYVSISGKRWFFCPNVMSQIESLPAKTEARNHEVMLRYAYTETDTTVINLPENIHSEFVPEAIEIQSTFGSYHSSYTVEQGKVIYTRTFQRNKGVFPSDSYQELVEFYQKVSKADRQQMVLRKST
uniref:DUF3857 domain-containing protein n=1 Tax=Roseihalotalea indica TaxID=2867963 RepID=A0AA49GQL9_9BACT|nr:DUF3857 domain-containing protein [Tunicatimonas sp. TK19036]